MLKQGSATGDADAGCGRVLAATPYLIKPTPGKKIVDASGVEIHTYIFATSPPTKP